MWKLEHDHFFYDSKKTREHIQQAFDDWANYTQLTFREVIGQEKADFSVAFVYGNHSDGYPFEESFVKYVRTRERFVGYVDTQLTRLKKSRFYRRTSR